MVTEGVSCRIAMHRAYHSHGLCQRGIANPRWPQLELTRIGGHEILWEKGVHNSEVRPPYPSEFRRQIIELAPGVRRQRT